MSNRELVKRDEARARNEEISRARAKWWAEIALVEKPIPEDMKGAGWEVKSVWDLVNSPPNYASAIPVLLKHLTLPYHDRIREGIARSLAIPEARYAWPTLVREYIEAPSGFDDDSILRGTKGALAVALSVTVSQETMGELIELARGRGNGSSRILLLDALKRSKNPAAKQALEDLATDPDLAKEIASWKPKKS